MVRAGILAAIAVLWLAAAYLLWQTEVPDGLRLPDLEERRYFGCRRSRRLRASRSVLRALSSRRWRQS